MLKHSESVKELEDRAAVALRELLCEVPAVRLENIEVEARLPNREIDILARLNVSDRPHMLVCEVKSNGQPRNVRAALLQLRNYVAHMGSDAVPMFIAPYLSPEAQALCKEKQRRLSRSCRQCATGLRQRLHGAARADRPPADRRELRSLFKPKSAQVLRVMLRDPKRAWRVTELAELADVSLGHVSNVRTGLLDREWAQVSERGLFLSEPSALLNAWRSEYQAPEGKRLAFYTILHGSAFEDAARDLLGVSSGRGKAIFASYSAAHWLSPFGRTGMQYFYADYAGLDRLKERLKSRLRPKARMWSDGSQGYGTVPRYG